MDNNADQFLKSSRTLIKQARRDRLKSPVSSPKLFKLILAVIIITPLFLWIDGKVTLPEASAIIPEVPAVQANSSVLPMVFEYDPGSNDYRIYEKIVTEEGKEPYLVPLAIGYSYQIPVDQLERWAKMFSNEKTLNRFANQFASDTMSSAILATRITESAQTGILNLSN